MDPDRLIERAYRKSRLFLLFTESVCRLLWILAVLLKGAYRKSRFFPESTIKSSKKKGGLYFDCSETL